jgi:hypothetical protein
MLLRESIVASLWWLSHAFAESISLKRGREFDLDQKRAVHGQTSRSVGPIVEIVP